MSVPTAAISQLVALDCLCGAHLEGEDPDDLMIVYREHLLTMHADFQMDRATLQAFVAANAYEV